ncbi:MAG: hypothetical protein ABR94_03945, partial [Sphingobacteriales bacterium BACL12 MAG-120802-bin5]
MNIIFQLLMLFSIGPQQADQLLINGRIYTVNSAFSMVQALAIKDGIIIGTGTSAAIQTRFTAPVTTDLKGNFVLPGFNDGHCHFLHYGITSLYTPLTGLTSFEAVLNAVKQHDPATTGGWLLGRGWDQNLWEGAQFPDCKALDSLYPNIPVYLIRVDGHAALANTKALEMAGIFAGMEVQGGRVVAHGDKCTGLLIDNAMEPIKNILPEKDPEFLAQALQRAQQECLRHGLTSVQDAGLKDYQLAALKTAKASGSLPIRVNAMISATANGLYSLLEEGPYISDDLTIRSVKVYGDGALGSRGAALLEPYSDDPENSGLLMFTEDSLLALAKACDAAGFQVCVHAIGDAANRQVLDVYEQVLQGANNKRWRIEHCQIIHPDDMSRFGSLSVLPSVQTTHATSDMFWADERLGQERIKTAYPYKELMLQNGVLVNGTDFPVEQISPMLTFFSAVARTNTAMQPFGGFQMENALDRIAALRSMTIWPAYASFEEDKKGSIEVGKFADLIILDADIMSVRLPEVPRIKVLATMIGGQWLYGTEWLYE